MRILVIGVAFVDVKGFPFGRYDPLGTNKGDVITVHGGVARNVAEDMAHLGADVNFPVMLDDDAFGNDVRNKLLEAGVDLSHAPRVSGNGYGMWLAVFNENGDLAGSISKMPDITPMETLLEEKGEELIRESDCVVVEFDMSERIADLVTETALKYNKPVYVIVGNMTILLKRRALLAKTSCIIMNEIEAGKVFETNLRNRKPEDSLEILLEKGRELGVKRFAITLGSDGCVYSDFTTGESGHVPARQGPIADTTGAGDSFFSAMVMALQKGYALRDAVQFGNKIASIVIALTESACPMLGDAFFDSIE